MNDHKPYPTILQSFGIFFIYLGFVFLFALLLGGNSSDEIKLFRHSLIYLSTFLVVHQLRKRHNGISNYNLHPPPLFIFITSIVAWFSLISLLLIFLWIFPELNNTGYLAEDHTSKTIYALLRAAVLAPVFEELIFRGVVLDGLLKQYQPAKAIFWSAILFSIIHLDPIQGSFAFVVGLLLGWVFWKTRSLLLCILLHAINNFLVSYNFEEDPATKDKTLRDLLTPTEFYSIYTAVLIIFVASIIYINRYYKKNIKPVTHSQLQKE